jgi:ABC-type glycerol-3-phosphate transport system substrate-binding protein
MNSRKVIAAILVSVSLISGCTNKNGGIPEIDLSVDTNGVTINFWTGFGAEVNEPLENLLGEFTKETGIIVNYESKGGYDNLKQSITNSVSSKTFPHIAVGYPDHFADYVRSGILIPLNNFFEKETDGFDDSIFYPDYMVENRSFGKNKAGDSLIFGVPFNKSTEVMTVNETLFQWLHSVNSDIVVPSTWEDLAVVGPKIRNVLSSSGVYGNLVGTDLGVYTSVTKMPDGVSTLLDFSSVDSSSFKVVSYDSAANLFITLVRQFGGVYTELDEKVNLKGHIKFDSPSTRQALEMLKTYHDQGIFGIPDDWEQSYSSGPFKFLMSAFTVGSTAGVANNNGVGFSTKCYPVLTKAGNEKNYVISQGTNLTVFNKGATKHVVAAYKLLKYLSLEVNGKFASETGYFPSNEISAQSEDYKTWLDHAEEGTDAEKLRISAANVNNNIYLNSESGWVKFIDAPFIGSAIVRKEVDRIPGLLFYQNHTIDFILSDSYRILRDYI